MPKMIMLKPLNGYKVTKPDGKILKEEGELVASGPYWLRRIKFGDVELCSIVKKKVEKKFEKKVEKKVEEKLIKKDYSKKKKTKKKESKK